MNIDNSLEEQLHNLIAKRQVLISEKKELENKIIYIKGVLLIPELNNEFNRNQLLKKQAEYQRVLSKLDNISKRFKLLCTKMRIVKINLKQDTYLKRRTLNKKDLNEAIKILNCYGCVETGEIFEGPNLPDEDIPITNLDRFELTVKTYRNIRSSKQKSF